MGDFVIYSYFFRLSRLEGFLYSVAPQGDHKPGWGSQVASQAICESAPFWHDEVRGLLKFLPVPILWPLWGSPKDGVVPFRTTHLGAGALVRVH